MGFDGKGFGDAMLFLAIAAAAGITFTIVSAVNTIAFLFTRDFSQLAWGSASLSQWEASRDFTSGVSDNPPTET